MSQKKKPSTVNPKRIARITGALCIGCCAIPVIGLALGLTTLAGLGWYFEQAAIAVFVAGLALFLYLKIKNRSPACKIDCSCQGDGSKQTQRQ